VSEVLIVICMNIFHDMSSFEEIRRCLCVCMDRVLCGRCGQ
jgi:hypothetical protein